MGYPENFKKRIQQVSEEIKMTYVNLRICNLFMYFNVLV